MHHSSVRRRIMGVSTILWPAVAVSPTFCPTSPSSPQADMEGSFVLLDHALVEREHQVGAPMGPFHGAPGSGSGSGSGLGPLARVPGPLPTIAPHVISSEPHPAPGPWRARGGEARGGMGLVRGGLCGVWLRRRWCVCAARGGVWVRRRWGLCGVWLPRRCTAAGVERVMQPQTPPPHPASPFPVGVMQFTHTHITVPHPGLPCRSGAG